MTSTTDKPVQSAKQHKPITLAYGKLPLRFEANEGQTDKDVRFLSRGNGYGIYLSHKEAVLTFNKPAAGPNRGDSKARMEVIRMQLRGSVSKAEPVGVGKLAGVSNYILGNDPAQWHTSVPNYAKVRYAGVYPGVDLVYYGNRKKLEYDFVLAPGADPSQIRLRFDGARGLKLDNRGDLVIEAKGGCIAFHKPLIYQSIDSRRKVVDGHFALLADKSIGFTLGRYDRTQPLVIDPTLEYSTYLGGSYQDTISAIALDSSGAAYLTGSTLSGDFPTTPGVLQAKDKEPGTSGGPYQSTAFITKLNASGTALIYSTFVGGSGSSSGGDSATAIAVDSSGDAYIAGSTYSSDFPTSKGAYQSTKKAEAGGTAGFVTKLNPTGTALVFSTYLSGSLSDQAQSLAIDSSGDVYVAGSASSADFPVTAGVVQSKNLSAPDDGWNEFVAKLSPTGTSVIYGTYLGGTTDYEGPEVVHVAVDSSGDAFLAGNAYSTDFPTTKGAYQPKNNGKAGVDSNLTLAKLNPTATSLLYCTYIGGTGSSYHGDQANGLAIDGSGNAYLTGPTYELNYPVTSGAFQKTNNTGGSLPTAYVTKMNPTGSALVYSTYLGGSSVDLAGGLTIDSSGDAYITGSTGSTDFPVTSNAYQSTNPAADNNGSVVFVTELNSAGSALVYSTYFGGANSFSDTGYGVVLGSSGAIYFAGTTGASTFPLSPGAYETTFDSQNFTTGFVAALTLGTAPATMPTGTTLTSTINPAVTGTNMTFTASVVPTSGTAIPTGNVVFSIDQANVATVALNSHGYASYETTTPLALGQHAILASYAGNSTYATSGGNITQSIVAATPQISPGGGIYTSAQLISIVDATPGATIYYTIDGTAPNSSSTKYTAPFVCSTTEYLQAIAVLTNVPNSIVASATYQFINAPSALAVPASAVGSTSATLSGLVNTYGMSGSYYFQYGTSSTALTTNTPKTALALPGFGSRLSYVPIAVSNTPTALTAKTTYYYRVVVATPAGTSIGTTLSFTTN